MEKDNEVKKNVRRVPRVLTDSNNSKLVSKLFEFGGSVMFDMVVFLGCNQMADLFGENWFTIQDFCKYMGLERSNLQRKLSEEELKDFFGKEKPLYKVMVGEQKIEHPIETVFEAALFKLGSENIAFPESRNGYTSYNFVQILKSFEIRTNFNTAKKTKRLYSAKLNPKILDGIFHTYNLIELNDYRLLPNKKGYKVFFLHLADMIYLIKYKQSRGEAPYFTQTVNELADIFNLSIKEDRKRKSKVDTILKTINECLNVTKFNYSFVKTGKQKWAYTVRFYFPEETLIYFDEKYKAVFIKKFYTSMKTLYVNIVKGVTFGLDAVRQIQNITSTTEEEEKFITWAYSDQDQKEKENVYRSTFFEAFGKEPIDYNIENINLTF